MLERAAGTSWLTMPLAARAGWVTAVEDRPERLAVLHAQIVHGGWPNVTLVPALADARATGPFDVVVAAWLASDTPNIRWLSRLAERRLILTGPLDDAELDRLRTSTQALGLEVTLHSERFGEDGPRAVAVLDLR